MNTQVSGVAKSSVEPEGNSRPEGMGSACARNGEEGRSPLQIQQTETASGANNSKTARGASPETKEAGKNSRNTEPGRRARPAKNEQDDNRSQPKKKGGKQSTKFKGPRANQIEITLKTAQAQEAAKNAPALDSIPPEKPKPFEPDYSEFNYIKICDITDVSIFSLLCQQFADHKLVEIKDAIEAASVRELKLPHVDFDEVARRAQDFALTKLECYFPELFPEAQTDDWGFTIVDGADEGCYE